MKKIELFIKNIVKEILALFNIKISSIFKIQRPGLNLNVGCGAYEIDGFTSLDYWTEHYYGGKPFNRVSYDMRNDNLPFDNETVDVIYCSHVIEHIETDFVENYFSESWRVLKKSGVLRISCPDSLFLYQQLTRHPEYFNWHKYYSLPQDAVKCFVDEVGTHKLKLKNNIT